MKKTRKQVELYSLIKAIEKGVVENNNLGYKEGDKIELADVDISRLYSFLKDIENDEYSMYIVNPG